MWAYGKLEAEKDEICWTDIRKLSGVKKERALMCMEILSGMENVAAAEKLISILVSNLSL